MKPLILLFLNLVKKLELEDLNAAIDSTENMSVDNPNPDEENVVDDSVQPSPKKNDDRKDVGPNVGTSLGQHDKQDNDAGTHDEDESSHKNVSEKEVASEDTAVNSLYEEEKHTEEEQTEVKSDPKEDMSVGKDEVNVVNVDDIDLDNVPLVRNMVRVWPRG